MPEPAKGATAVSGSGIRAGSMATFVTKDGVTRQLRDMENQNFTVEIFESKARAIAVFKALACELSEAERIDVGLWLLNGST